ncbi:MAG: glycosyltransferase family 2 protein [Fibrobacteria bacterium]|nr:glycosyltransferase family 2 protein [Fibrobacteria bacterium]
MNQYNKAAPLLLFTYNRPEHTEKVLRSIQQAELADQTNLIIHSDGPKDEKDFLKVSEVRRLLRSRKWCGQVKIYESEKNKGLAESIISMVSDTIKEFKSVIVLEDDIVIAPVFIKYMQTALVMYENENELACIQGHTFPVKELPSEYFLKSAHCWGWATWERAWKIFDRDGKGLLEKLEKKHLENEFDYEGAMGFVQMLRDQISGKNQSWAILWRASVYLHNKLSLYPGKTLIKNIGMDNSGTHCTTNRGLVANQKLPKTFSFEKLPVVETEEAKRKIIVWLKERQKKDNDRYQSRLWFNRKKKSFYFRFFRIWKFICGIK